MYNYTPSDLVVGEAKPSDVIDLTQDRDEKEDLQRAIALSLQETTQASIGVSAEEQDISRWGEPCQSHMQGIVLVF